MKPHNNYENKSRGSAVLEYTVVFPVVLLSIFALFYMGFIMHQKVVLDSAVSRGTIEAARLMSDPQYSAITGGAGGGGGALDFNSNSYTFGGNFSIEPYRYILRYSGDAQKNAIETHVEEFVAANSLWGTSSDVKVEFSYKNYVLYQEVSITAEQRYPLPKLFGLIGLPDEVVLRSCAVQAVTDPDEVIRNVDLVIDLANMALAASGSNATVEGTINNVVGKITDFAGKLFGSN